jgi:hypothetical protein
VEEEKIMSEQSTQVQFEEYIKENLIGDTQQNALNFVRHLASIGMTSGGSANDGQFIYKGVKVCNTYFGNSKYTGYPEPWTIWTEGEYSEEIESIPFNDRMKEIAWANVHNCDENCPNRNTWCSAGQRKIIFGREFDNVCVSVMGFTNPDTEAVECTKKLMEIRKHTIEAKE